MIVTVFAEFPGILNSLCACGSILGAKTSLGFAIFMKQNLAYGLVWVYEPGGQLKIHGFLTNISSDIYF